MMVNREEIIGGLAVGSSAALEGLGVLPLPPETLRDYVLMALLLALIRLSGRGNTCPNCNKPTSSSANNGENQ